MTDYDEKIVTRQLIGLLRDAIEECIQWEFDYAASLVEPLLWARYMNSNTPWSILFEPQQRWTDDGIEVIQIAIDIYDDPKHFGATVHFFGDNRQREVSDIWEFINGVPIAAPANEE